MKLFVGTFISSIRFAFNLCWIENPFTPRSPENSALLSFTPDRTDSHCIVRLTQQMHSLIMQREACEINFPSCVVVFCFSNTHKLHWLVLLALPSAVSLWFIKLNWPSLRCDLSGSAFRWLIKINSVLMINYSPVDSNVSTCRPIWMGS